ncbi:MAG TPA: biopolymer transporter ExbD [Polyangiaceae bacterium]|jgi:biopolymer transport protein ExbD|nr:biopolymer transporter ExbD [Polyangiaceae bacterium]
MAMTSGGKGGVKNEINVTPLVDVVLVLLIIFMVVTPMLQRGKDVRLPQVSKPDEEKKDSEPLILSVTAEKTVWIESDQFTEDKVEAEVARRLTETPGKPILLKGDETLTFGDVRKVMELARRGGAKGVGLGVQELKK